MAERWFAATWWGTARESLTSAGSTLNHIGAMSPSETSVSKTFISVMFALCIALFSALSQSFFSLFSVNTITREPLHLA